MTDFHKGNSLLITTANQVSFYHSDIPQAKFPQQKLRCLRKPVRKDHSPHCLNAHGIALRVKGGILDFHCFALYSPGHIPKQLWRFFFHLPILILQILTNLICGPDLNAEFQTV